MRKAMVLTVMFLIIGIFGTNIAQARLNWNSMVVNCEARGHQNPWYVDTGNGFYFGPQFTISTWHSEGGGLVIEMGDKGPKAKHMTSYSIRYITRIAENTYRDQGDGAWPMCHYFLY